MRGPVLRYARIEPTVQGTGACPHDVRAALVIGGILQSSWSFMYQCLQHTLRHRVLHRTVLMVGDIGLEYVAERIGNTIGYLDKR